jgi:choline dehydrogenase
MLESYVLLRVCLLAVLVNAWSHATIKCRSSQLLENYDFIIAGGGTTGLTVADRLSVTFPKSTS